MPKKDVYSYLKAHLNVAWLRPESALWDTIASTIISKHRIIPPSLDLGCGNGIFSFITAGGEFSLDYDWYINTEVDKKRSDIYDAFKYNLIHEHIKKRSDYFFTFGLDHKKNLLRQAEALDFYEKIIRHDANLRFHFEDERFSTVFSNILYWLKDPRVSLKEIHRILRKDGTAIICVPNTNFYAQAFTYSWRKSNSELLRILNMGRSNHIQWTVSYRDFSKLAKKSGLYVIDHKYYLSPIVLKVWDIGLRSISPFLIKMVNSLSSQKRREIKIEWMRFFTKILVPLLEIENKTSGKNCAFHLFLLKK